MILNFGNKDRIFCNLSFFLLDSGSRILEPQLIGNLVMKLSAENQGIGFYQESGSERRFRVLLSISGLAGCLALIIYFSAPFLIFPFPSADASSAQIISSAATYQLDYMLAAWLQGTGTFLVVIFVLSLVYTARAWNNFAGWITMLASAAILMLSLSEGTFFIDVAQAISNGHPEAAVASFDLTFVFLHSFFIAPSLLLPLAFVLRRSTLLPRIFWLWAFALGVTFEIMGLSGILFPAITLSSIVLLVLMMVWIISASVTFSFRKSVRYD